MWIGNFERKKWQPFTATTTATTMKASPPPSPPFGTLEDEYLWNLVEVGYSSL